MRTLDEIFHKEERDYSELKQTESQLAKAAVMLWGVCLLSWLVVGTLDPEEGSDLLLGVAIIFTIFPPFIAAAFATPLNLIPYRDFNYRERFPRIWLICLIVLFALMTIIGLFALVTENFS